MEVSMIQLAIKEVAASTGISATKLYGAKRRGEVTGPNGKLNLDVHLRHFLAARAADQDVNRPAIAMMLRAIDTQKLPHFEMADNDTAFDLLVELEARMQRLEATINTLTDAYERLMSRDPIAMDLGRVLELLSTAAQAHD